MIKEIWNFLWKSNSIWSWIVDLILAFLIVRFMIFPLLSFMLSTPLPLVVVESGSMEHKMNFDSWWLEKGQWYIDHNISKEQFEKWNLKNGFNKGDIIIAKGSHHYEKGDIIIFKSLQPTPIIHRIISQNDDLSFQTKGDHNSIQLPYEKKVKMSSILGKAWIRIPYIGWIKLFFVELIKSL